MVALFNPSRPVKIKTGCIDQDEEKRPAPDLSETPFPQVSRLLYVHQRRKRLVVALSPPPFNSLLPNMNAATGSQRFGCWTI
jgi:hypothetical protein